MANETLSEITAAITPLSGTELVYGTQLGGDAQFTTQAIANLAPGSEGGSSVNVSIVTLTGAQIAASNVTPITIVPAPGAGLMSVILQATYSGGGTSNFTAGGEGGLYYNGDTSFPADGIGVEDYAFNQGDASVPVAGSFFMSVTTGLANVTQDPTFTVNQPITYFNGNTAYTGGTEADISMTITVLWYAISV